LPLLIPLYRPLMSELGVRVFLIYWINEYYIFITGASGVGKTTTVRMLEKEYSEKFTFYYFDSVGVPSNEEMIRVYGSGENWQRITTEKWVKKYPVIPSGRNQQYLMVK